MKHTTLTVLFLLAFFSLCNFSASAQDWSKDGNSADTSYVLGTTNATDLVIITGGSVPGIKHKRIWIKANNGNVGIGTPATTGYRLSVEGWVRAREIVVDARTWSDFVFKPDYNLMNLYELEQEIKKLGHLPGIPSEKEVTEQGVEVGTMQNLLLQKVEELTLYIIEQNKKLEELQTKVKTLENK